MYRKRSSYGINDAVDFLVKATSRKPYKGKGNEELTSALELIELTAQNTGLSPEHIDRLIDVAAKGIQVETVCKRLIKALVPASVVPGSAAVKCISWLCTRKPSINIQCLLLRWILVVYDCIDKKDGLHSLYGVIFHFLHYRILMPYVCHLLYLLTRKEDVRLYRVRYLLQFQKDMGTQPFLTGLLSVYRHYYPNLVHVVNTRSYKSFFPTYDRKWKEEVRQIQEKTPHQNVDSDWQKTLEERLQPGTSTVDLVPSRKRRKIDPIPIINSLATRSNYSRDQQGHILGVKTIPFILVRCFQDILDNIESLEFPSQIGAVLRSQALKHMMSYTRDATAATRFEFWISETLHEEIMQPKTEKNKERVTTLLSLLREFEDFIQEGIPTVDLVLSDYLQHWNGLDYSTHILKLLARFRLHRFEEQNLAVLEPLRRLFFCSSVYFKCKVVVCLTEMLRNQAARGWTENTSRQRLSSMVHMFHQEEEVYSKQEALTKYIQYVCKMLLAGCVETKFHPLYETCVLDFLELVSSLHVKFNLPFVVFVETRLFERLMISRNANTVARLCEVICRYKESFSSIKSKKLMGPEELPMIRNCNQIIRDMCNCVWRLKAYTTDDKLSVFYCNPADIDSKLEDKEMAESLSVVRHPALLPFTVKYSQNILQDSFLDLKELKNHKKELLAHLSDHNLDGLQQFVATFVRVKTSTSGTPHRTVLSTLSQGNNSAFGF
ncbi:centromere protein I-like isoform X1 [Dreissena polymorpha]|nr:centromere protein I-like isoform X1 [Dreissena polymorpha]